MIRYGRQNYRTISRKEFRMKRIASSLVFTTLLLLIGVVFTAPPARAGNPHFVGTCTATLNPDNTVTVAGKEAGLGDEAQIDLTITVIAECINGGGNHPKATNKTVNTFTTSQPVQNGKADYSVLLGPLVTSPSCTPPMTLAIASATVTDTTNSISQSCTVQ
jgi:hypothetical protein